MSKKNDDFPLFLHRNGQWAKKIKGKFFYFGKDKDQAAARWDEERHALYAGRTPVRQDGRPSLRELGNAFHDRYSKKVAAGEVSKSSLSEYKKTIARMIEFLGADCRPDDLSPVQFADLKDRFAEPVKRTTAIRGGIKGPSVERRSIVTVSGDLRRARAFLNWCRKSKLVKSDLEFGPDFSPITAKAARQRKQAAGRRNMVAADIRAIIDNASVLLRPLILLGINGGVGNYDLANMELSSLRLVDGENWLDLPRLKTGAPRRFLLWPETVKAICDYLAKRPTPKGDDDQNRLFLTRNGSAWVRGFGDDRHDAIGNVFKKARTKAGLNRGSFYDLRRTFATVASETRDFPACRHIMGHASSQNDMSALYVQEISDDRLRAVCNHVREWLYGATDGEK